MKKLIKHYNSHQKLAFCFLLGVVTYIITRSAEFGNLTTLMIGWDVFVLLYLIIEWITFGITQPDEIRLQSRRQDPKRTLVFALILISTLFSVLAIILMIISKDGNQTAAKFRIPTAILGMVLSWFLVHTLFALRYAHIFYGNDVENPTNHVGGLDFPETKKPNYMDFAYFSFVLGMTFQVSDVEISSQNIRKLALLHGLISFSFTTVIFAIVINVMS